MTTTEVAHSAEYYNPDDVFLRGSPLLKPRRPNLLPSPSPPPAILRHMSRSPSPPTTSGRKSAHRKKIRASQGDGVLIAHLAGGNRFDISRQAAMEPLASDDEMEDDTQKGVVLDINSVHTVQHSAQLAALAAGALAHSTPEVVVDVVSDESAEKAISEKSSAMTLDNPVEVMATVIEVKPEPEMEPIKIESNRVSPSMRSPGMAAGELAPIQEHSPKSDKANGNVTLPSINAALGNLKHLAETATAAVDKDANGVHLPSFSQSPPGLPHFVPANGQPSSPISPGETFQRLELPSPRPGAIITNQYYYPPHLPRPQQSAEGYTSGSTVETPSTDSSGPTPATATAIVDRMSIDGITHPQVGGYQCDHPGCTAQPFQTQYLLNSHANVHSSSRPHYCTVKGCARSEGGKGFKRKNEMIRHGLVHDSPGYVCPFCPDREHKYPRPDNLQRHVRVHHVDKDKDDPKLRDVLSQRPEGPNRGRRRRGGTN